MRITDRLAAIDISYELLTELSAITAIATEWDELLARSCCNPVFSSAQWFIARCRLDQSVRPHVMVARRGDALVAILPLVLIEAGTVATFPDDEGDYHDIVTARDDVPAMTGLLDHALTAGAGYHRLFLSRLRDDSNSLRAAQILDPSDSFRKLYRTETSCPYASLSESYEEYLKTRTKSFRSSILQAQRQAERHNLRVTELEPESFPSDRLAEIFLSLHLNRFADHSALASPIAQSFVRQVFPRLFVERLLRAFALYEAEKIIAINVCIAGVNSLCLWNGGFTAAAERWSPGKLLIGAGIRQAYALNMTEYDFLRGSETYKSRWANDVRTIGRLEFTIGH